jgi:deazaflavin-dependent oxidoreductase (nitroreductase family)
VLVLETVGRRSGQARSTPVVYLEKDGGYLVTPANAGSSRTPAWWLNLREAGEGVAVVRGRRQRVRPRELSGAEAERAWAAMQKALPAIDDYRTFTGRRFPVVMLQPAD